MAGSSAGAGTGRRGFAHWLVETGDLPAAVRLSLLQSLYGTLPLYFGGVVATLSVAIILALRIDTPAFYLWAALELIVAVVRLHVLFACRRAARAGRPGPAGLYAGLSLLWASGVGFGAFIAVDSGDWLAAMAACVSSAAMLGGICFRYFAAPRLVCAMLLAMALPAAAACLLSGETVLIVSGLLMPIYVAAMTSAAWRLNAMMVKALCAERAERHRASHDSLTGLLNRDGFAQAVAERPAGAALACYFVDLDGFKRINDTLGHRAGDELLAIVAQRLRQVTGDEAILARPGGDEFLAIVPCHAREDAQRRGDAIVSALAGMPYLVGDQGVFIGASVGAALRSDQGEPLDALIAAADDALYRAKATGTPSCMVAGHEEAAREAEASEAPLKVAHG